jgi:hypothetical protein
MTKREMETALAAADPVGREWLDGVDLEAMEAELFADAEGGGAPPLEVEPARPRPLPRRRLVLGFGAAAAAVVLVVVLVLGDGGAGRPDRAYGAELIRFAEASPRLLLDGPGWRVADAEESRTKGGLEGRMDFVTGKEIASHSITIKQTAKGGQYGIGIAPATVRQRKVELTWSRSDLAETVDYYRRSTAPHGHRWTRLPVLGTSAAVDERAEVFVNQGGPGDREMVAFWQEDGLLLELRASVPDLAGFEERLGWLTAVDTDTWLDAMPAKVVKSTEHEATVKAMLRGVTVPAGFEASMVPEAGLTTSREQVADETTDTVACLWMRQWGEARAGGDAGAEAEAERAMASSRHWPILRERAGEPGATTPLIWQLAAEVPQGYWDFRGTHRPLLKHAEGMLGCARLGVPLLPRK